jgi:hypothetical protein
MFFNQTDAAPQTLLQKKMELREHLKVLKKCKVFVELSMVEFVE